MALLTIQGAADTETEYILRIVNKAVYRRWMKGPTIEVPDILLETWNQIWSVGLNRSKLQLLKIKAHCTEAGIVHGKIKLNQFMSNDWANPQHASCYRRK